MENNKYSEISNNTSIYTYIDIITEWITERGTSSARANVQTPPSAIFFGLLSEFLSGFLAEGHLSGVSRQSANDKSDNEMMPEAVDRSSGIYLTAEENTGKPQLGYCLMKWLCDLQMSCVGSHSTSGREHEGKEEILGNTSLLGPRRTESHCLRIPLSRSFF
jgi:hypothetical protein